MLVANIIVSSYTLLQTRTNISRYKQIRWLVWHTLTCYRRRSCLKKIIQLLGRSDLLNLMLIKYVNGEFNNKLTHLIETLPREIIDTILHTRVVSYYNGSVVVRSHIKDRLKQIQQSKKLTVEDSELGFELGDMVNIRYDNALSYWKLGLGMQQKRRMTMRRRRMMRRRNGSMTNTKIPMMTRKKAGGQMTG